MSTSRPFAYNPSLITSGVSEQYGSLSVGFTNQSYGNSPGGLKWWNGPDEELGYVIGTSLPTGGQISPDGTYGDVTFWRTDELTDSAFLSLSNQITGQNFTGVTESVNWLNSNGYWVSIETPLSLSIYLGGLFDTTNKNSVSRAVLLNSGGTLDTSFNYVNTFNGAIITSTNQSDGKILVGGVFTSYSGVSVNGLARLNTDGSLDTTFNIGTGFDSTVSAISVQPDGKILVGGYFSSYSGASYNRIIRLNTDGSIDISFNPGDGFSGGMGYTVDDIAILPNGDIVIGGAFTTYSGVSYNRIIKLDTDGSIDTSFNPGDGFNGDVHQIIYDSTDGNLFVGGEFNSYSGVSVGGLVKLDLQGVLVSGFNANVSNVFAFARQSDGKIITGGQSIYRLNSDGSIDSSFNSQFGNIGYIITISVLPDGKILVGGSLDYLNDLIKINSDGSLDTNFDSGLNNTVSTTIVQPNGKIFVGGYFTSQGGFQSNSVTKLMTDGDVDIEFNSGSGFDSTVYSSAIQSDGKILFGGLFNQYSGMTNPSLIRLNSDGTKDMTFNSGFGPYEMTQIYTIKVQSDNKILAGGYFNTQYSGLTPVYGLIRLNSDGDLDTSFITSFNTNEFVTINTVKIQSDGKILVGGNFTTYTGVSYNHIVRLNTDGSIDNTFNIGTGFNSQVRTLSLQSDGKIIVGGDFTTYSGVSYNRIIRLNSDGTIDATFNVGTGFQGGSQPVNSIIVQSDGKIFVGGNFDSYQGISRKQIVSLNVNGTIDYSFNFGTGFNYFEGNVNTIEVQSDGKVIVGGDFPKSFFSKTDSVARLNADGSIDTTFTGSVNNSNGFPDVFTILIKEIN